jgi:hypothetical protein
MSSSSQFRVTLAVILAVALGLIFLFNVGVGLRETLSISESSRSIVRLAYSNGGSPDLVGIAATLGLRKTLLSLPTAILYFVGGVNDLTTQAYPIFSALANVVLVYLLANTIYGKKVGWLTAFLFIALPVTLFTATALPLTQPTISFSLCLLLIYSHRGQSQKNWLRVVALTLLFIILMVLDFLLALCLLGLILTLQLLESGNRRFAWLPTSILFVGLIVGTGGAIGNVFVDFYDNLLQIPEMEILLPITFIVLILALWQAASKNLFPLLLLAVSFAGLLWRSSTTGGAGLIGDSLFSMLLLAVAFLTSALFSQKQSNSQNRSASIWLPPLFFAIALLTVSGQKLFVPSFAGLDWISLQTLTTVLGLLPGPVFLSFIAYSLFSTQKNVKLVGIFSVILPFLFAVALIPYSWQRWHANQPSVQAVSFAKDIITESGVALPIYVVGDDRVVDQLNYMWKDEPPTPVIVITLNSLESELELGGGYIVYWEDTIKNPPANWWQMDVFGALGLPRLVVARVVEKEEALKILEKGLATPPTSKKDFERLIGAAINVGNPCFAISTWIESQRSGVGTEDYFPLFDFPAENCFTFIETENLLAGQEPTLYPGYNPPIQYLGEQRNLQEGAVIGPKYPFFEDPRIFYLEATLQPNAIYAYHVELLGAEFLMPLYWKIGDYENYLDYGLYNHWNSLTVLISTYGLGDEPLAATLSPFMYYVTHYGGAVELRDLKLFLVESEN